MSVVQQSLNLGSRPNYRPSRSGPKRRSACSHFSKQPASPGREVALERHTPAPCLNPLPELNIAEREIFRAIQQEKEIKLVSASYLPDILAAKIIQHTLKVFYNKEVSIEIAQPHSSPSTLTDDSQQSDKVLTIRIDSIGHFDNQNSSQQEVIISMRRNVSEDELFNSSGRAKAHLFRSRNEGDSKDKNGETTAAIAASFFTNLTNNRANLSVQAAASESWITALKTIAFTYEGHAFSDDTLPWIRRGLKAINSGELPCLTKIINLLSIKVVTARAIRNNIAPLLERLSQSQSILPKYGSLFDQSQDNSWIDERSAEIHSVYRASRAAQKEIYTRLDQIIAAHERDQGYIFITELNKPHELEVVATEATLSTRVPTLCLAITEDGKYRFVYRSAEPQPDIRRVLENLSVEGFKGSFDDFSGEGILSGEKHGEFIKGVKAALSRCKKTQPGEALKRSEKLIELSHPLDQNILNALRENEPYGIGNFPPQLFLRKVECQLIANRNDNQRYYKYRVLSRDGAGESQVILRIKGTEPGFGRDSGATITCRATPRINIETGELEFIASSASLNDAYFDTPSSVGAGVVEQRIRSSARRLIHPVAVEKGAWQPEAGAMKDGVFHNSEDRGEFLDRFFSEKGSMSHLLVAETGSGKTYMMAAAIAALKKDERVVVICPSHEITRQNAKAIASVLGESVGRVATIISTQHKGENRQAERIKILADPTNKVILTTAEVMQRLLASGKTFDDLRISHLFVDETQHVGKEGNRGSYGKVVTAAKSGRVKTLLVSATPCEDDGSALHLVGILGSCAASYVPGKRVKHRAYEIRPGEKVKAVEAKVAQAIKEEAKLCVRELESVINKESANEVELLTYIRNLAEDKIEDDLNHVASNQIAKIHRSLTEQDPSRVKQIISGLACKLFLYDTLTGEGAACMYQEALSRYSALSLQVWDSPYKDSLMNREWLSALDEVEQLLNLPKIKDGAKGFKKPDDFPRDYQKIKDLCDKYAEDFVIREYQALFQHHKDIYLVEKYLSFKRDKPSDMMVVFGWKKSYLRHLGRLLERRGEPSPRIGYLVSGNEKEREKLQEKINKGEIDVLFCSSAGLEGLHVPNASSILIMNPPARGLELLQMFGRCAHQKEPDATVLISGGKDRASYYAALGGIRKISYFIDEIRRINSD